MRTPDDPRLRSLTDFLARTTDPAVMAEVDAVAAEVMTRFHGESVPFLLLKGPALATLLYRPGEQRRYMDVDLMIPPEAHGRASAILAELGFENDTAAQGVDDSLGAVPSETWQRERHLLGVDLHTRMPGCTAPAEEAWPRLYDGHQTIVVGGCEASVLSRAGLALHLAIHAAQHGTDDVKAIGDLERGVERWSRGDWEAAASLADGVGATEPLSAGLRLTAGGRALADQLGLPASTVLSWEIEHRALRPRGTFHVAAMSRAGIAERASILRRALFPKPEWIAREYGASGSRVRLAVGYARHMLRTPRWALRAWAYRRRMRRETGA